MSENSTAERRSKAERTAVIPTRRENFPDWYQEVIKVADLAEHAPVRGCMVIKPHGYSIWEAMQRYLDDSFKKLGVENAYFPLFIPQSFLEKEAEHVEGFAKECAVVTHSRLEKTADGKMKPASPLEEALVVRPTSEMIIGSSFARWIESYRDLPMKINQWCNVVRWEMRPRLFLRTAEFLWQEGHTAHETAEEADRQAREILELYARFAEEILAIPVIRGEKSENERFPGAKATYTFEAMMQDGKALQMGTSHFMGENFAKASEIKYLNKEGELTYVNTTSWGVTTRMIGSVIMTHADDNGMMIPPRIAPKQVMIIPVVLKEEHRSQILAKCEKLQKALGEETYFEKPIHAAIDTRDLRAGEKSWDAVKKGYPLRIEIGMRDLEKGEIPLFLRTEDKKQRRQIREENLVDEVIKALEEVHFSLYQKAVAFREENSITIESLTDFEKVFKDDAFPAKFIYAPWAGDRTLEEKIQKQHGVTIRCIPFEQSKKGKKHCFFTNAEANHMAVFAKSY